MTDPLAFARFRSKVAPAGPTGCWQWTAARGRDGYGRFRLGHRMVLAHRFAFEAIRGPIPDGLELDHLCRDRGCVNPEHLEPVTGKVNTLRGVAFSAENARKTHCARGHELGGENVRPGGSSRRCLTCDRDKSREYQQRRRSA